jgi:hypothetical protein
VKIEFRNKYHMFFLFYKDALVSYKTKFFVFSISLITTNRSINEIIIILILYRTTNKIINL